MINKIQEIIQRRDSTTEQTAKEATKEILALKPTKEQLCEVIFLQDNQKTEFEKQIFKYLNQIQELKDKK